MRLDLSSLATFRAPVNLAKGASVAVPAPRAPARRVDDNGRSMPGNGKSLSPLPFQSYSIYMETVEIARHPSLKENILTLSFILITIFLLAIIPVLESLLLSFLAVFLAAISLFLALSLKGFVQDILRFHTKDDAIRYCSKIAQAAHHDYFSLGGECNAEFYENRSIITNLSGLISQNVKIRILFGPNYDIRSINLLRNALEHSSQIEVRRLKKRYMGDHFKVADEEFIHVGYSHPPLASEREGYIMRSRSAAGAYKNIFELNWDSAETLDIKEMVCRARPIEDRYLTEEWMEKYDAIWGESAGFITVDTGSRYRSANEVEIAGLKDALGIKCSP